MLKNSKSLIAFVLAAFVGLAASTAQATEVRDLPNTLVVSAELDSAEPNGAIVSLSGDTLSVYDVALSKSEQPMTPEQLKAAVAGREPSRIMALGELDQLTSTAAWGIFFPWATGWSHWGWNSWSGWGAWSAWTYPQWYSWNGAAWNYWVRW